MTLQVLTVNVRPPYSWTPERPMVSVSMAGGGGQRASLYSRELRRYSLPTLLSAAEYVTLRDFLQARGWGLESFLWKDLQDYSRTGVALTNTAGNVYTIPLTGTEGGDYPDSASSFTVYDAGVPVGAATCQQDDRTFTLPAPPGGAVTADYEYFRRVKAMPGTFVDSIKSPLIGYDFELAEVVPNG